MTLELVLDSAGRIELPESVRDALHLKEGDRLHVETHQNSIIIQPIRGTPGIGTILGAIEEDRDERAASLIYPSGT